MAFIVTVQVFPEVLSQPDQPAKVAFDAGLAVKVTEVPILNEAEQVVPQLIPPGAEVRVPLPAPDFAAVREKVLRVNVAVTDFAALIVTEQEAPVAVSQPVQPEKLESATGAAVRVTEVPVLKKPEQSVPQLTPAGKEVTVPEPLPSFKTVRATV